MQTKTERDYKVRDRNALISLAIGVAMILWWLIAGIASGESSGGIIALLGLVLVVNGYYFFRRRP